MLNLTRRKGEVIVMTIEDITIRVMCLGQKSDSGAIKLGIDAPAKVRIMREELVSAEPKKERSK